MNGKIYILATFIIHTLSRLLFGSKFNDRFRRDEFSGAVAVALEVDEDDSVAVIATAWQIHTHIQRQGQRNNRVAIFCLKRNNTNNMH